MGGKGRGEVVSWSHVLWLSYPVEQRLEITGNFDRDFAPLQYVGLALAY